MSATTIFSIQGRGLKLDTADDIKPLLNDVDPAILEEIHLGGNTIGVQAAEALAQFLAKTQVLKIADFADIFTGRLISEIPEALTFLCTALIPKTTLLEINLSDNAFGGRSVDPMVPLLTHNRAFHTLKLTNNGLGPAGGAVIANALYDSALLSKKAGEKSNLRSIICGRNRLENGSSEAWAKAFAAHGTLEEIRMPQNGIRMEGVLNLLSGLAKNPQLRHIDLQDNTFTADGKKLGIEAWAEAMPLWPHLRTLNLSDCVLSCEGEVPELISKLAGGSNRNLEVLQLQNNNLENATVEVLANAVGEHLPKLTRLELQWNDLEEEGDENVEELAIALKARGGRLIMTDEEEEEEAEEEAEREEAEEEEVPAPAAAAEPGREKPLTAVDKATSDLADLLAKVHVN